MTRTIAPPKLPPLPKRRGSSGEHHIVVGYRKKLESINDGLVKELDEITATLDQQNATEETELLDDDDVVSESGFPPPKERE